MPTNNLLNYISPDQRRKQSANRLADQWEPEYVAPTPQLPPEGREPAEGRLGPVDLNTLDKAFLGVGRLAERKGVWGTPLKLYNDVIQRNRTSPITENDFKPEEMATARRMVLDKIRRTNSPAGHIGYGDYDNFGAKNPNERSLMTALGAFQYSVGDDGHIGISDNYDFNTEKASKVEKDGGEAERHPLAAAMFPLAYAAGIGRMAAPAGKGVPVSISIPPEQPHVEAAPTEPKPVPQPLPGSDQKRRVSNALMTQQWEPDYQQTSPMLPPEGREPWVSDGDILQRSELFPAGIYQQPDGSKKIGLAWPGILSGELSNPGDHSPEAGEAYGRTALSNAMFPSAVGRAAGGVPANALGSFGGRLAKTADHAALARAEELTAAGISREQVWNDTGWFKGVDGKWRFEIDDSGSRVDLGPTGIKPIADNYFRDRWYENLPLPERLSDWLHNRTAAKTKMETDPVPASNIASHPGLFRAYPGSADIPVTAQLGDTSWHDPAGKIGIGYGINGRDSKSKFLHEVTHDIQQNEGFARGGNPGMYERELIDAGRTPEDAAEIVNKWGLSYYNRLAGEVEARTTQKRMDMSVADRAARPPWLDYDIPENQQLVRLYANGPNPVGPLNNLLSAYYGQQPED